MERTDSTCLYVDDLTLLRVPAVSEIKSAHTSPVRSNFVFKAFIPTKSTS